MPRGVAIEHGGGKTAKRRSERNVVPLTGFPHPINETGELVCRDAHDHTALRAKGDGLSTLEVQLAESREHNQIKPLETGSDQVDHPLL